MIENNTLEDVKALEEHAACLVRIQFIKAYPHLAPLMYSIRFADCSEQPASVAEWLAVMQHELNHAKLAYNKQVDGEMNSLLHEANLMPFHLRVDPR